ncbi:tumor necrosis factor receptor superfamily member 11A isoform X2 [Oxyura jamaicensis]|uniref:tumor necrosis factor receptor superfamily member 11A isoform X2 n=1 Tax=Oxyura jamaicensis TaxID=8884 RepID=UPI0015A55281|nr:tumor necrosis factor receptor superfamily member 11A isoform X2 [Oxyura jamaicensis]
MPGPPGWLALLCLAAAGHQQLSLQSTLLCDSERHYEYSGRCCTKCEPGKYMSAKCTATSDSVCQPCGPNEYMDVWNEEDKCLLHKICDQGKALKEVNPGNSTFQRQCACTTGYHWNEDCDCCQRNTICAPGFGIGHPVQQDKDTKCMPCPRGYFSKVASSTDECKAWTNCTALGMAEVVPGTDKSDAVCAERKIPEQPEDGTNKILYVLIVILFFVALIGIVIFIVYYKNKGKKLTDLQNWANEVCSQIKGTKEPPRDAFIAVNIPNAVVPPGSEDMRLLGPAACPAPGSSSCAGAHTSCSHSSPSTAPCEARGNLQQLSVVTETDNDHFPPVPTEDEYMDKELNAADYLSLLSRPDSKTVSSFSEPVEIGENDSLNQCFSGVGSTEDISVSQGSDSFSDADGAHAAMDKYLQKSYQRVHSCPKEIDNKDTDRFATNHDSEKICVRCGISYRESPRKWSKPCCAAVDSASTSPETGSYAQCTCGLNFLSAGQSTLASDHGMKDASSDGTSTKHQNTSRSASGTNSSTSDLPPASGNVTGNSNSTFISSGQVMNFKGDIIVVYLSQNSQEGATASGAASENVGSPVQEENPSRCETFAGNAQHYKEKCAELHAVGAAGPRPHHTAPVPSPGLHREASQPVQEEGRLGHSSEKVLN